MKCLLDNTEKNSSNDSQLTLAKATELTYQSPYLGKVTLLTFNPDSTYLIKKLGQLDDKLVKDLQTVIDDQQFLANMPYIYFFAICAAKTRCSEFRFLPQYIFVTPEVFQLCSPNTLIRPLVIWKDMDAIAILDLIRRDLQDLINLINFQSPNVNRSLDVAKEELSKFIHFFGQWRSKFPLQEKILKEIKEIITYQNDKSFSLYDLSSQLTMLFNISNPSQVREVLDFINNCAPFLNTLGQTGGQLWELINEAFRHLERTLEILSYKLVHTALNIALDALDQKQKIKNEVTEIEIKKFETIIKQIRILTTKFVDIRYSLPEVQRWYPFIQMLVNYNFDINYIAENNHSHHYFFELLNQARIGNHSLIESLIPKVSSLNFLDDKGYSALAYTVINNQPTTFNLLLEKGASLDWQLKGDTLVSLAVSHRSFEMIPLLKNLLSFKAKFPLFLLSEFFKESNQKEDQYSKAAITALAYLLSYSNEQLWVENCLSTLSTTGEEALNSLIEFRKNVAILYILYQTSLNLPADIIFHIATSLGERYLNEPQGFYKELISELIDKQLFPLFLKQGKQTAFIELQRTLAKQSIDLKLPQEQIVVNYYSSQNLSSGAISLAAVILSQRFLQFNPIKTQYVERCRLIQEWKEEIESKGEDEEGITVAICQACNELGITDISTTIYRNLYKGLNKLVIQEKQTPRSLPTFFKALTQTYQTTLKGEENLPQNIELRKV